MQELPLRSNYGVYTEKGKQHEERDFIFGIGTVSDLFTAARVGNCGECESVVLSGIGKYN